jgi:hypothetical protein
MLKGTDTIVAESEAMTSLLMDCALYDWYRDGKNLVQSYVERHPPRLDTDEGYMLQAMTQAAFRILIPLIAFEDAGIDCLDMLTQERVFVMDVNLSRTLLPMRAALASRTLNAGEYSMTTGAGLPLGGELGKQLLDTLPKQGLMSRKDDGQWVYPQMLGITVIRKCLEAGGQSIWPMPSQVRWTRRRMFLPDHPTGSDSGK